MPVKIAALFFECVIVTWKSREWNIFFDIFVHRDFYVVLFLKSLSCNEVCVTCPKNFWLPKNLPTKSLSRPNDLFVSFFKVPLTLDDPPLFR